MENLESLKTMICSDEQVTRRMAMTTFWQSEPTFEEYTEWVTAFTLHFGNEECFDILMTREEFDSFMNGGEIEGTTLEMCKNAPMQLEFND